ncbi:MAG: exo-alpha-sialidase [Candidatus Bathyarchaeia archaeon]
MSVLMEPIEIDAFRTYIKLNIKSEIIKNIRPHGHACNVIEHPDFGLYLFWYCGSYEGAEDQIIAGATRDPNDEWNPSKVILGRFEYGGDEWIPEISVPILNNDGSINLYFFATPISSFILRKSAYMISLYPYDFYANIRRPLWVRSLEKAKIFRTTLIDGKAQTPTCVCDDEGMIVYGPSLKLKSGRWMIPCHKEIRTGNFQAHGIFHTKFLISKQSQEEWELHGDIFSPPFGCLEPTVVQLPDEVILCYMRFGARGGGHIWRSTSLNEGQTWSPPTQTNLRNPHSGTCIALSSTGKLLIAFNDSYLLRTPLCVGVSQDLGKTFYVRDIEMQPGEYSYPKLLQTSDGLWHLFYTYNRTCIKHVWFEEEWLMEGRIVIGLRD